MALQQLTISGCVEQGRHLFWVFSECVPESLVWVAGGSCQSPAERGWAVSFFWSTIVFAYSVSRLYRDDWIDMRDIAFVIYVVTSSRGRNERESCKKPGIRCLYFLL